MSEKAFTALITTGGTGGHIFPGIAVAKELMKQGWQVVWVGSRDSLEEKLVPENGIRFEGLSFHGIRGKGVKNLILGPFLLLGAVWHCIGLIKKYRADVVVGFGGFASFPCALASCAKRVPLALHESNAVGGLANKLLLYGADRVLVGFPGVFDEGEDPRVTWSGNPLRKEIVSQAKPEERFASRANAPQLNVLVAGGSLGAKIINETVPAAFAKLPKEQRPRIVHQSGAKHIDALKALYEKLGVEAACVPFINEMAEAYADADLVICRGGSMTVSELAAVGVGSLIVPFGAAIANEQDANANELVKVGGAVKMRQPEFTPDALIAWYKTLTREKCLQMAKAAYQLRKDDAVGEIARCCGALAETYRKKHKVV